MLISAKEVADRLNAMEDGDLLAIVKFGDDFEVIDMDHQPNPKGKHHKKEGNDGV
jgi:hypothetical protein